MAFSRALRTLLTLAAVIYYGLFAFPLPWKVTDPGDPRFDPADFRFTDYPNSNELRDALQAMFPVGTEKEAVDALLAETGARITPYKAGKREKAPPNLYYYSYWNLRSGVFDVMFLTPVGDNSWKAGIYYDDADRVVRIVGISP